MFITVEELTSRKIDAKDIFWQVLYTDNLQKQQVQWTNKFGEDVGKMNVAEKTKKYTLWEEA